MKWYVPFREPQLTSAIQIQRPIIQSIGPARLGSFVKFVFRSSDYASSKLPTFQPRLPTTKTTTIISITLTLRRCRSIRHSRRIAIKSSRTPLAPPCGLLSIPMVISSHLAIM
jgi:hypothetical protein